MQSNGQRACTTRGVSVARWDAAIA